MILLLDKEAEKSGRDRSPSVSLSFLSPVPVSHANCNAASSRSACR